MESIIDIIEIKLIEFVLLNRLRHFNLYSLYLWTLMTWSEKFKKIIKGILQKKELALLKWQVFINRL